MPLTVKDKHNLSFKYSGKTCYYFYNFVIFVKFGVANVFKRVGTSFAAILQTF